MSDSLSPQVAVSAPADIIVDNLGAGFTKTGTWNESAAIDEYAGSSVTATAIGAKATWRPTLSQAGTYDVYAWWSAKKAGGGRYDRDSHAGYVIHYSGGTATRSVDQDLNSGQWVRLGTFAFKAGTGGYVDLARDAADGVSTCADAVRFVFAEQNFSTWYVDDVTDPLENGSAQHPFDRIQEAIDKAQAGDDVVVNPGLYREHISFRGLDIKVRSVDPANASVVAATVLGDRAYFIQQYGEQSLPNVVNFTGTESAACVLAGLTITGGRNGIEGNGTRATIQGDHITANGFVIINHDGEFFGAGIADCDGDILGNDVSDNIARGLFACDGRVRGNSITRNVHVDAPLGGMSDGGGLLNCNGVIEENVVWGNTAFNGGGLANCDGIIRRNIIKENNASDNRADTFGTLGGGLYDCDGVIENNVIDRNSATVGGGIANCDATIRNCTFFGNMAFGSLEQPEGRGEAVFETVGTIANCIIVGTVYGAYTTYVYCDVVGSGGSGAGWNPSSGIDGGGNIDADPRFADASDPDGPDDKFVTSDDGFRLLAGSPCIDAGHGNAAPTTDILGNARHDDIGIHNTGAGQPDYTDIGAYEFQSMSPTVEVIVDNLDAGFSKTGIWNESAAVDEYAGSSVTAMAIGATATWRPNLPEAGTYQVYAWWSDKKSDGTSFSRDSAADYVVHDRYGSTTYTVDQNRNSGQWNLVDIFTFDAGSGGYVQLLRNSASGVSTCADAVKFVRVA